MEKVASNNSWWNKRYVPPVDPRSASRPVAPPLWPVRLRRHWGPAPKTCSSPSCPWPTCSRGWWRYERLTCTRACVVLCPLQVHSMLNVHDVHISYLPLAHMFERVVQVCLLLFYLHIFEPALLLTLIKLQVCCVCMSWCKLLVGKPVNVSSFWWKLKVFCVCFSCAVIN